MVAGAFGPWFTLLEFISIRGIDGNEDGWLVVAFAVAAAAAFLLLRRSLLAAVPVIAAGALSALVTIWERTILDDVEGDSEVFRIGWGLDLAIAGSICLALSGLAWLFVFERQPDLN